MKICLVCLGNICRSPAAEGIFRQKFPDWEIDSAGTGAWHIGEPPDPRSIEVCAKHGIDISDLKARQVQSIDGENFDYIIAMDAQNKRDLHKIIPAQYHHKIKKLDKHDVNDPYFSALDGFEIMFQHLERAADNWESA